jgi:uncharacterized iron-regulated protein
MALSSPTGAEEIYPARTGEKIAFDRMMEEIEFAKVVFVGEVHDQLEHHQIQLQILRALLKKGKEITIGMEMFERRQQPILDRWIRGDLTQREFRKEVERDKTWGREYVLYRPILEEAKARVIKIIALNVERSLVSKVARNGIKGLSAEDRTRMPDIDLSDKEHRAYIRRIYRQHHGGQADNFERFYESQCLWDEGMAETLSDYLKSPEGQKKTVLVLAGGGHIVYGFGIPKRFFRRTPLPFRTVVLKPWSKAPDDQELSSPRTSSPIADFLWITRPDPQHRDRPRIGLFLSGKDEAEGLRIERVIPGSPAEKAGLLAGDRIIAVEGEETSDVAELHEAVSQKGWGSGVTIRVIRGGLKKEVTVTLPLRQP